MCHKYYEIYIQVSLGLNLLLPFSIASFRVRVQKAFRHLLQPRVSVRPNPGGVIQIELHFPTLHGKMAPLAHIAKAYYARTIPVIGSSRFLSIRLRHKPKSNCIPGSILRRPRATAGIAQIAESLKDVLRRIAILMTGRGTVATPPCTQRQARRMRPTAVFKFFSRHKVGTGQIRKPPDSDFTFNSWDCSL